MKSVFYGLLTVLLVVIGALLIGPSFVDWNRFKPEIVGWLAEATGRDIAIDGPIAFAMLPAPTLSAERVRIKTLPEAADDDLIALDSLGVRVGLVPLIAGKVRIESVILVAPRIQLERLPDGRATWRLDQAETPSAAGGVPPPSVPTVFGRPIEISVEEVTIERGRLVYRDSAAGIEETVGDIDAVLSAGSLSGPFAMQGSLVARGLPVDAEVSLGEVRGEQRVAMRARLASGGVSVNVSGGGTPRADEPGFDGRATVTSASVAELVNVVAAATGRSLATTLPRRQRVVIESQIAVTPNDLSANELEIRIGDTVAKGKVSAAFADGGRFEVALDANRIDVDALVADLAEQRAAARGAEEAAPAEAEGEAAAAWAPPAGLNGSLDLTVDAVLYREQIVRQAVVNLGVAGGMVNIQRLSALLPGGSDVTLFGSIDQRETGPHFSGQVDAASDNLRAMLDWFDLDVAAIPADRLRKFSLSAEIEGDPKSGQLTNIDVGLDTTRMVGGVAYAMRARPAFGVNLRIDRMNLDAYLPAPEPAVAPPRAQPAPPGPVLPGATEEPEPAPIAAPLAVLAEFDADFVIQADSLTWRDVPVAGLRLDGLLQGGVLTFREAQVDDLAGARTVVTGRIERLGETPAVDLALRFDTADLSAMSRVVPVLHGVPPAFSGALRIDTKVRGDFDSLAIDGALEALSSRVAVAGTLAGLAGTPRFEVDADLSNADLAALLDAVGAVPRASAPALLSAPVTVAAKLAGTLDGFDVDAGGSLADARIALKGRIEGLPASARVDLLVESEHPDLARLLSQTAGLEAGDAPVLLSGPVAIKGGVVGTVAGVDVDARIEAAGIEVRADGRIDDPLGAPRYTLTTAADHADMRALLAGLGVDDQLDVYDGPATLSGRLTGSPEQISVPNLSANLGGASVVGSVALALEGARPRLTADLITGPLVVEHLLGAAAGFAGTVAIPAPPGLESGPPAGAQHWSREPLDLSLLRELDATVKLSSDALSYDGTRLEAVELDLGVDNGTLRVERLVGRLFGGDLSLDGQLVSGAVPSARASVELAGVDLRQALGQLAGIDVVTGRIGFEGSFTTRGTSQQQMMLVLNGRGRFRDATGGVIEGLDLPALSRQLDALEGSQDVLGLLAIGFEGGETRYSELRGTFSITDGRVATEDTYLVADGGTGSVTGTADLAAWQIDATAMFTLADHPEAPPVGVHLSGPLDAPQKSLEAARLDRFLLEKGLGEVIREQLPAELPEEAAPEAEPEPEAEPAPAESGLPPAGEPAAEPMVEPSPPPAVAPEAAPTPEPAAEPAPPPPAAPEPEPAPEAALKPEPPAAEAAPEAVPEPAAEAAPAPEPAPAPAAEAPPAPPAPAQETQPSEPPAGEAFDDLLENLLNEQR